MINAKFRKSFATPFAAAFVAAFIALTIALAKSAGVLGWEADVNRKRMCDNNEDIMIQDSNWKGIEN